MRGRLLPAPTSISVFPSHFLVYITLPSRPNSPVQKKICCFACASASTRASARSSQRDRSRLHHRRSYGDVPTAKKSQCCMILCCVAWPPVFCVRQRSKTHLLIISPVPASAGSHDKRARPRGRRSVCKRAHRDVFLLPSSPVDRPGSRKRAPCFLTAIEIPLLAPAFILTGLLRVFVYPY